MRTTMVMLIFFVSILGPSPVADFDLRISPPPPPRYPGLLIQHCVYRCECSLLEDVKVCFANHLSCVDRCLEIAYLRATQ